MAQAPRTNAAHDQNRVPTLIGVSTTDGTTPVPAEVDPANGQLQVSSGGGSGGDGAILDGASAAIKATVLDYVNSNPLAVRLSDTAGDYVGAGAGTQYTEDVAAAADPIGTALNLIRKDTLAGLTTTDGDNVAARGTDKGELYVKHADAIAVTTIIPGTAATNLGKAEDAAHVSGDTGVGAWGVANEAQSTLAADGDYIAQATDTKGNRLITGNIAHDGVDAGAPIKVGGKARTAPPTAVAASDRVDAQFDIYGKQVVRAALREDLANQATTITSSTAETTIVTADATYKLDLYGLTLSNTSASATKVTIKDSTAGTTRFILYVPAGDMRGFMLPPDGAHKQAAANNNWTVTCGTSIATLEVTALTVRSL